MREPDDIHGPKIVNANGASLNARLVRLAFNMLRHIGNYEDMDHVKLHPAQMLAWENLGLEALKITKEESINSGMPRTMGGYPIRESIEHPKTIILFCDARGKELVTITNLAIPVEYKESGTGD